MTQILFESTMGTGRVSRNASLGIPARSVSSELKDPIEGSRSFTFITDTLE